MSKRLTNIRRVGRYKEIATNKARNIHKGRIPQRGCDVMFYLYRGKRVFVSDFDISQYWEKVPEV